MKSFSKINKCLLLVAFICYNSFSFNSFSQESMINWGQAQEPFKTGLLSDVKIVKTDGNYIYYYCLTQSNAGIAFISIQNPNSFIVKYDKKTGSTSMLKLNFKVKEYNLKLLNYYNVDSTFHVFTYFHNKKQKKIYLFHETLNLENLVSNNDIAKISEIDLKDERGFSLDEDNMSVISDNNKYLFNYSFQTFKGRFFGKEVFDNKLTKEWGNSQFALTEAGFNFESNYKIDNEGNVYAIQRNFEKEKDVYKHYDRSRIWAVCYPKGGNTPSSLALILDNNYFVTAQALSVNEKNEVICAGLYAKPETESAIGCFSFVIEPLLAKIKSINTKEFSAQVLTKGLDYKKKDKNMQKILEKKDFEEDYGYDLSKIHFRKDGGFDVVAEKNKLILTTRRSGNSSVTQYNYYYDDLYVLTFNADGTTNWVQKVAKYEYVIDGNNLLGSYFLGYDNDDNMNFVFNLCNEQTASIIKSSLKESKTVLISLDKNGNEKFKELVSEPDISKSICPRYSYKQDNENSIIITRNNNLPQRFVIGYKQNYLIFGELNLK